MEEVFSLDYQSTIFHNYSFYIYKAKVMKKPSKEFMKKYPTYTWVGLMDYALYNNSEVLCDIEEVIIRVFLSKKSSFLSNRAYSIRLDFYHPENIFEKTCFYFPLECIKIYKYPKQ